MKFNRFILIGLGALLTGCVGHYQQPAASDAHAVLDARWGENEFMSGGFQGYWAYYDAHCHDTPETGVLGALAASDPTKGRFRVDHGRRIYLSALSSGIRKRENTDPPIIHRSCLNVSSFVPLAGATYQVTHSAPSSGCFLEVIDKRTGKTPPTLLVESVTKECGL